MNGNRAVIVGVSASNHAGIHLSFLDGFIIARRIGNVKLCFCEVEGALPDLFLLCNVSMRIAKEK